MDSAGILSEAQAKTLNEKLNVVSRKYNAQINIVTIASMADGDIDGFLEYLYDNMEMGYGASHDGVLLLLAMVIKAVVLKIKGGKETAEEEKELIKAK